MVAADYLRWLRRSERFSVGELRRYVGRFSCLEMGLVLTLFTRGGAAGATAGDALVDVLRGLEATLVAFRFERDGRGMRIYVRRAGAIERARVPALAWEMSRAELRHLLVAELTRRGCRAARTQLARTRWPARTAVGRV